jgi:hypothetical protein
MPYVEPNTVIAPRTVISEVEVVYDSHRDSGNEESWSVAKFLWDGEPRLGIRWNGDRRGKGIGTPQAFGQPTWFLVPRELEGKILAEAEKLAHGGYDALKAGYAEMAQDREHESEALEWSEGLVGDAAGE